MRSKPIAVVTKAWSLCRWTFVPAALWLSAGLVEGKPAGQTSSLPARAVFNDSFSTFGIKSDGGGAYVHGVNGTECIISLTNNNIQIDTLTKSLRATRQFLFAFPAELTLCLQQPESSPGSVLSKARLFVDEIANMGSGTCKAAHARVYLADGLALWYGGHSFEPAGPYCSTRVFVHRDVDDQGHDRWDIQATSSPTIACQQPNTTGNLAALLRQGVHTSNFQMPFHVTVTRLP
jgi:hypothetical protein